MGFMRLFKYIQGENVKKKKIPMTAPVAVIIQPGQGPFCKNNFTVNFFVPFEDQTDPAEPTNKDVFISTQPKFCAYVISYGGYSNIDDIQKYSEELDEALVKDGLGDTYRKDIFFYAGYDSPTQGNLKLQWQDILRLCFLAKSFCSLLSGAPAPGLPHMLSMVFKCYKM